MSRKVCVVTGSRAEYGLLALLMREIAEDNALALQLVVTGAHLSPRFGESWREIADDDFRIDAKVDIGIDGDSRLAAARAMGRAVSGLAEAFDRLRPDVAVVLGDRYEILAAAEAALLLRLPLAHIHGGELTEGAFDDAMRHAITKLADLHFVACDDDARRVIQLGEEPGRVRVVGALGVDAVAKISRTGRDALAADLGITLVDPVLAVTYHPATLGKLAPEAAADALCAALDRFPQAAVVFTGANADPGGRAIDARLKSWANAHKDRACWHESLGQRRYLSLLAHAVAVVGNSSSGLIEAPALKVATVNIGDRQKGRPHADSVIDCGESAEAIAAAVATALSAAFRARLPTIVSPYGAGGAATRIRHALREIDPATLGVKRFHEMKAA
jgi:UDP-hydrolysing UDP-N-acetyl-D-glucosamine 2-epimerase